MNDFEIELLKVLNRIADAKEKSVIISEKNLELNKKNNEAADEMSDFMLNGLF